VFTRFSPNRVLISIDSEETRRAFADRIPAIAAMREVDGRAAAYVCRNYACQLPVSSPDELAGLLQ
jgi:hypothetical protein